MNLIEEFHDLADFEPGEISELLALAAELEKYPEPDALKGKVLALLFLNPSLRTLTSFQATMTRLGGGAFVISPEMSIHRLETHSGIVMDGSAAEHIREAVPVIASYADVIGIRSLAKRQDIESDLADKDYNQLRALCDIPLVNLESAIRHPCQSLADWKTLDDFKLPAHGGKLVFSWVYHPESLPLVIPSETIHMAAMRGMDVTLLHPEGFELPHSLIERANTSGAKSGGAVSQTSDRETALQDADVVYAGSWSSTTEYGNRSADQKLRNQYNDWCIDESWFNQSREACRLMHCMPVRRGIEVEDTVLDGPRSIITRQAQNRMYAQMAIIYRMFKQ